MLRYKGTYGAVDVLTILALTATTERGNIAIMNIPKYPSQSVAAFLKRRQIATIEQISAATANASQRTVFRILERLEYISSYTHRGKFYSLRSIAKFSLDGLWNVSAVWFSRSGNLLQTAVNWVNRSEAGCTAAELNQALHVETKHALTHLTRQCRLQRQAMSGRYVYFSADDAVAGQQRKRRAVHATAFRTAALIVSNPDLAVEEAKATVLLFFSMLNEKQRRLFAGLESLKLGYGGDAHIAALLGVDPHTVARGRQELGDGQVDGQTVRVAGAGRRSQEKKRRK